MSLVAHLFFTVLFSAATVYAQEDEETEEEKLFRQRSEDIAFALSEIPNPINCSSLKLRYYHGFPSWVVGARDRNTYYETAGKVAPEKYKGMSFTAAHRQKYYEGEKTYIKPIYSKIYDPEDPYKEPESKFLGFAKFQVSHVIEQYNSKKHGSLPLVSYPDVVSGSTPVRPLHFRRRVRIKPRSYESRKFVSYEVCYNPTVILPDASPTFINALRNEFGLDHYKRFFSGSAPSHVTRRNKYGQITIYNEDDIPTLFGYRAHIYDQMREDMHLERYDAVINTMTLVRNIGLGVIPGVGTGIAIYDCYHQNDVSCWAGVGLDIVSDAAVFIRLGKVANITSKVLSRFDDTADAAKVAKKLNSISNKTLYFTAAGNIGVGTYYANNGKALEGIARFASGVFEITFTHIDFDKITVGKAVPGGECKVGADDAFDVEIKDLDTDLPATHHKEHGVDRINPPNPTAIGAQLQLDVDTANRMGLSVEFEPVRVQEVHRLDHRHFDEVREADGCFPNPKHPPADSLHDQLDSPTSTYLSTTYADNVEHLIRIPAFFPKNNRVNYKPGSPELEDLIKKVEEFSQGARVRAGENGLISIDGYVYWPDDLPLPEPVKFETFEYMAETAATRAKFSRVDSEMEAVAKSMPLDEMIGARQVDVYLEFYNDIAQLKIREISEARIVNGPTIDINPLDD